MNKTLVFLLVFALFLSLGTSIKPSASGATVVKVDPSLLEYQNDATGQQFTVAIKIIDVTNLYGFDIKLRWNTTFLAYVSHSIRIPRDTYADGVLWNPVIPVTNEVNATEGTYWIAYASRWPAPTFSGSGTVFNITFQIIHHPAQPEPDANITLELYSTDLSNQNAEPISHNTQHGTVILHAILVPHDVAIIGVSNMKSGCVPKPAICNGSLSEAYVTVENQGGVSETFDVTAYANTTMIAIQSTTLDPHTQTRLTFSWNTSLFQLNEYDNYTLSATATQVQGETDLTDNTLTDGTVVITHIGDINGDEKVDIQDVARVSGAFGSLRVNDPADPKYGQYWHGIPCTTCPHQPNTDLTGDRKVDIQDLARASANFGWHRP